MKAFHIQEASFRLSDGWEDQTINVFVKHREPGRPFSLIVARQKLEEGQTLAAFAEQNLGEQAEKLPRFKDLGKRARVIGGLEAIEARTSWVRENIPIYQYQVFTLYAGTLVALTMSGPLEDRAECEALMTQTLADIRFRKPE